MSISKYSGNPIITKNDVPFRVNSIFNPGVTKYNDEYLLLCRVEMPDGRSSFVKATSKDGYNFKVENQTILTPKDHGEHFTYCEWGIEDPRITKLEDRYIITYTGYSKYMPLVFLSETKDFKSFKIHGPITEPSNKDCAIFPERIGGYYWKIDRPSAEIRRDMWISRSPDLIHWGSYKILTEPRMGTWENDKIGLSSPPIKTHKGWLLLYHGVRGFGVSSMYKVGAMLLDLNNPWKIIGRTNEPILFPETDYERIGDVQNVVFTCGWFNEPDGKIKIYYSGADTNICLAETSVDYLLSLCN